MNRVGGLLRHGLPRLEKARGLLFGSGTTARLNSMEVASAEEHRIRREVWHAAMAGTTGAQVLVGIAGIVLGILALVSISPLMLTLVGLPAL